MKLFTVGTDTSEIAASTMPPGQRWYAQCLRCPKRRRSLCTKLAYRHRPNFGARRETGSGMPIPRTILVATDFSEYADQALAYAVDLAAQLDGTIHLVHAVSVPMIGVPELGVAYSSMIMA